MTDYSPVINKLLKSNEPSIRYKILVDVLGENPDSSKIKSLQKEIKNSAIAKALLFLQNKSGEIITYRNVYDKWQGAHWVLAALADISFPKGEKKLIPVKNQVLRMWLDEYYYKEFTAKTTAEARKKEGVPLLNGRFRRCCSQQGNALYSLLKLGFDDDEGVHELAKLLLKWQWPDGGWNCDKNPAADTSSFMESLLPMRGLVLYSKIFKDKKVKDAAKRASEVFLERKLYKRKSNDKIINKEFTLLHYPLYWHYDILAGLKVLAEGNFLDERCHDALDLLESKRLKDGGFPAEKKYYTKVSTVISHGADYVNWGGTGKKNMNEWVTADALFVLGNAGRLN